MAAALLDFRFLTSRSFEKTNGSLYRLHLAVHNLTFSAALCLTAIFEKKQRRF